MVEQSGGSGVQVSSDWGRVRRKTDPKQPGGGGWTGAALREGVSAGGGGMSWSRVTYIKINNRPSHHETVSSKQFGFIADW